MKKKELQSKLWEIAGEITRLQRKCMLEGPAKDKKILWEQVEESWFDHLEEELTDPDSIVDNPENLLEP